MVHNAFDSVQILKDCPVKIESVGLWGARLLLGCIDGSLRIYAPQDGPDDLPALSEPSSSVPTYTLKDTRVGFAKKAVTGMEVLQSRRLLITLSDAVVIHTLPDFEVVSYLSKSKGSSLYSWDEDRGLLAVAKGKRVHVYRYDGNRDFVEMKDLPASDTVKAMAWCAESLCLALKRDYIIMNISTGASVDVFPFGRIAAPLIVGLPHGDLLLGKDNIGVLVDQNAKSIQGGSLSWSEAPATVVTHVPYALARLSRFIEVRSLRAPHGLVQMLPLKDINLVLSSDAGLVAASDHAIYRILPVPFSVQVTQLLASDNFEEALALCKLLPPEESALRAAKEDAIHLRYGHYLFEQGDYTKAMEHYGASSLDLITILALFPSIKVPSLVHGSKAGASNRFESGSEEHGDGPLAGLSSDLSTSTSGNLQQPEKTKEFQDSQQSKIAISALSGFLLSKRGAVIEKAEAEETDAAVAAMVDIPDSEQGSAFGRYANIPEKSSGSVLDKNEQYDARELASVLDTAVVQALLATNTSQAALQLLKGPNFCDVSACEEMMLSEGHYLELLELYKSHRMHREALKLLNRLAERPDSLDVDPKEVKFEAQDVVNYLMTLGDQDPQLILESSDWVLKNTPDQAMKLFSTFSPPLPVNLVLAHLEKSAPELRVFYLENMLSKQSQGPPADVQSELMQLYLTRVLEERTQLEAEGKWDEKAHSEARQKLLKSLQKTSSTYSPEGLLQRLPPDGLYQERAYLLGQLGQHRLALTLYVHKLHEPEMALDYCDHVHSSIAANRKSGRTITPPIVADHSASSIYLSLLEVYLKPTAAIREYDRQFAILVPSKSRVAPKPSPVPTSKPKSQTARKIVEIEGADGIEGIKYGSSDSTLQSLQSVRSLESLRSLESVRSDPEDLTTEVAVSSEESKLDDALFLLSRRWDRFDGSQALRMIPSDTILLNLRPFLEPLLRTSSETYRNTAVIKNLHRSENLQVREELLQQRKRRVKITSERTCSICRKKIGSSVFAVYPNGTLAHFVCHRDRESQLASADL